jgi:hypothetical protein
MPKAVREVKSFNLGVVTAADDNDIKRDAATFSRDIDPNSTQGRLKGRYKDVLIDSSASKTVFQFIPPETAGNVPREISIVWSTNNSQLVEHSLFQNQFLRGEVTLSGPPPTSNVVVKIKIDDYTTVGSFVKLHSTSSGTIPSSEGEELDITFTSSNWAAVQLVYVRPQNITITQELALVLQITAQSSDSNWNSSDVDFNRSFNYISNIIPAVLVKESTFDNVCQQGLQGSSQLQFKLSTNPNFATSTGTVDLTFVSQNTSLLKAHKADNQSAVNSKTLSFNNANYGTYQTLEPFGVDVAEKNGNQNVNLSVTASSNGSPSYLSLDTNLQSLVRFDTGNFTTNDFIFDGTTNWNILILEDGGSGGGDDGSGDSDDDGTKGFTKP